MLLYPKSDNVSRDEIKYVSDDKVNVDVSFIELRNTDNSIANLVAMVC